MIANSLDLSVINNSLICNLVRYHHVIVDELNQDYKE